MMNNLEVERLNVGFCCSNCGRLVHEFTLHYKMINYITKKLGIEGWILYFRNILFTC